MLENTATDAASTDSTNHFVLCVHPRPARRATPRYSARDESATGGAEKPEGCVTGACDGRVTEGDFVHEQYTSGPVVNTQRTRCHLSHYPPPANASQLLDAPSGRKNASPGWRTKKSTSGTATGAPREHRLRSTFPQQSKTSAHSTLDLNNDLGSTNTPEIPAQTESSGPASSAEVMLECLFVRAT